MSDILAHERATEMDDRLEGRDERTIEGENGGDLGFCAEFSST